MKYTVAMNYNNEDGDPSNFTTVECDFTPKNRFVLFLIFMFISFGSIFDKSGGNKLLDSYDMIRGIDNALEYHKHLFNNLSDEECLNDLEIIRPKGL